MKDPFDRSNDAQVPVVAGTILKKDNKYLLVQEAGKDAYGLWSCPGGHVEKGGTIEETAVRETKEESGFDINIKRKLGIFHQGLNFPVVHIFEGEIIGGSLNYPKDELLDARWMTLDEIKKIKDKIRRPFIFNCISLLEENGTDTTN